VATGNIAESDVLHELDRLLTSRGFATSPRLCSFLRFIVEKTLARDTESLKESVIGTEVFDRGYGYNPKSEPIVRTEARRLRAKLDEFYSQRPRDSRIIIAVPRGGYVATFAEVSEFVAIPRRLELVAKPSLDAVARDPALEEEAAESVLPPQTQPKKRRQFLVWALAASLLATSALVIWIVVRSRLQSSAKGPVTRFAISLPAGRELINENGPDLALSPDGEWLAYVARENHVCRLYVQRLDSTESRMMDGSESAVSPLFAPDGKSIAVYQPGRLRRFWLDGTSSDLASIAGQFMLPGLAWDRHAGLLFNNAPPKDIERAPSVVFRLREPGAGQPEQVTPVDLNIDGARALMIQQVLPGAGQYLVSGRGAAPHERFVAVVSPGGGKKIVMEDAMGGRYVPSGHLIFYRDGNLLAAPFDLGRQEITGPPTAVLHGVSSSTWQGPDMALSASGTLAYTAGLLDIPDRTLLWVDHSGHESPLPIPPGPYNPLDISPDGSKLLLARFDPMQQSWALWSYGLRNGLSTKLAGPSPDIIVGCWSHDGRRVIFGSKQHDRSLGEILEKSADGTGVETQLTSHAYFGHFPQSRSNDGNWLAFGFGTDPKTKCDVWLLDLRKRGHPVAKPFVQTEGWDSNPAISPDGRWIAYDSTVSGESQVYLQPFPDGGQPRAVTVDGGAGPIWSPTGRLLYYRAGSRMMAVRIEPAIGHPAELFHGDYMYPSTWQRFSLLSPDGERFLVVREAATSNRGQIRIVVNWFSELATRLAR
jgi:serine/threonine-protein kinase